MLKIHCYIVVFILICKQNIVATTSEDIQILSENEEMEDNYQQYDLSVELYPLDTVTMIEGGVQDLQLVIQTNWTKVYEAGDVEFNNASLPIWLRCPGVIRVTSDTPDLLEVVNGTLEVTGAHFLYTNHTVTIVSHHNGPAYQYLQVHWTSSVPIEECTIELLLAEEESEAHPLIKASEPTVVPTIDDTQVSDMDIHLLHDEKSNMNVNQNENSDDLIVVMDGNGNQQRETLNENQPSDIMKGDVQPDTVIEKQPPDPIIGKQQPEPVTKDQQPDQVIENQPFDVVSTENPPAENVNETVEPMEVLEDSILRVYDYPVETGEVHNNFVPFQVFRRRRKETQTPEWQDPSEIHHHHRYDETGVNVKVTEKPKEKKLPDILLLDDYKVAVLRVPTTLDTVFVVFVSISVAFNTFMMGMQLDYKVVMEVFKKPIGPAVGIVSQFVFMPLASFGLAHLFLTDINLQLGLFTLGCSPGGNSSNFWTLMLHGDLNLSITMTFISTTCAIFMMPFWLYTLGSYIFNRGQISIPFLNLFLSLVSFTVPVVIGLIVRIFKPKWAAFGRKLIKPVAFACMIVINILAIFNALYIFRLMTWQTIAAGMCVAWGGYFFGGTLAYICRQKKPQIIAISIETAIQSSGITFMVLRLTLSQPSADLSAVAPVSQMMVTTFPLMLLYVIIIARRKIIECRKKRRGMQPDDPLSKDTEVGKPLMINNITIAPRVVTNDDKQDSLNARHSVMSMNARPRSGAIHEDQVNNIHESEHLYENYPPDPRILHEGETSM